MVQPHLNYVLILSSLSFATLRYYYYSRKYFILKINV